MEQAFSLTAEVRENRLIIATTGYINNVGGAAIAKEFNTHFAKGTKNVILNLAQSKVVNSIGMSFLIEIIEQLNEVGGKLVFTNLDPAVEKMLAIMGLFSYADKQPTVAEALASLANRK